VFEIGNSLREARLRQGLDFPEIEQATKIRGKYLRALEEEAFEVLPAQTYVKGFLRSYADYLGLDGQLYVDEFNSRYVRGEFEEEEEQPFRPTGGGGWRRSSSFQGRAVLLTVAVIVGLTIFVFMAAKYGNNSTNQANVVLGTPPPPPVAKTRQAPVARIVLSAAPTGNAVVTVFRGTRTSKPIFQGTLERGQKHVFVGRRLWIYVFAPANLRLRLNGRPWTVPGQGHGSRRWLEVTPTRVLLGPAIA
jgi:cytoskeletal protein RodZ